MSVSESYHQLARSPLGRALEHYIQNGMAPNFLRRLTLRLCYWYQSMTGRRTSALDVQIYRKTRTTLEELRYAYSLWHRHRYPCRCGCEANNTNFDAFSSMVNLLRGQGWLGELSEDDFSTGDGNPDGGLVDGSRNRLLGHSRDDERARSSPREPFGNENLHVDTRLRYSAESSMGPRREEAINSRSRSSPPDPPTEQRNAPTVSSMEFGGLRGRFTHRASNSRESRRNVLTASSNDIGDSRNISTAYLMNRVMGSSDAEWSTLNWRARPSPNVSRRTSRRSRNSSVNGRGMRGPRESHSPSTINTRNRSGSLGSSMADRERPPITPMPYASRLFGEGLRLLPAAERALLSARMRSLFNELQAGPLPGDADVAEDAIDRHIAHMRRRITSLMFPIQARVDTIRRSIVDAGEES